MKDKQCAARCGAAKPLACEAEDPIDLGDAGAPAACGRAAPMLSLERR